MYEGILVEVPYVGMVGAMGDAGSGIFCGEAGGIIGCGCAILL
jgi:hypothetical protein